MAAACFGMMAYNASSAPNQMYVAPTMAGQATNVIPSAYFQVCCCFCHISFPTNQRTAVASLGVA